MNRKPSPVRARRLSAGATRLRNRTFAAPRRRGRAYALSPQARAGTRATPLAGPRRPGRLPRHDDRILAIYEAAGFTSEQADLAATTVLTFVLGSSLGPAAEAARARKLSRDDGDAKALMRDSMAKALEIAAQYPRLRTRLETAADDEGAAPDNSFEFGLKAVLDGLGAQLAARRTPASQDARKPLATTFPTES